MNAAQKRRWAQLRADLQQFEPDPIDGSRVLIGGISYHRILKSKISDWIFLSPTESILLGHNAEEALDALEQLLSERPELLNAMNDDDEKDEPVADSDDDCTVDEPVTVSMGEWDGWNGQSAKTYRIPEPPVIAPYDGDDDDTIADAIEPALNAVRNTLTVGARVKFAYSSEPWALTKDPEKVHVISRIEVQGDASGHVSHVYVWLKDRDNPVFGFELVTVDAELNAVCHAHPTQADLSDDFNLSDEVERDATESAPVVILADILDKQVMTRVASMPLESVTHAKAGSVGTIRAFYAPSQTYQDWRLARDQPEQYVVLPSTVLVVVFDDNSEIGLRHCYRFDQLRLLDADDPEWGYQDFIDKNLYLHDGHIAIRVIDNNDGRIADVPIARQLIEIEAADYEPNEDEQWEVEAWEARRAIIYAHPSRACFKLALCLARTVARRGRDFLTEQLDLGEISYLVVQPEDTAHERSLVCDKKSLSLAYLAKTSPTILPASGGHCHA